MFSRFLSILLEAIPTIVDNFVEKSKSQEYKDKISGAGVELMGHLFENTPEILKAIGESLKSLGKGMNEIILNSLGLEGTGRDIVAGIVEGMTQGAVSHADNNKIEKAPKKIFQKIKDFFQIKSPSRLFRDEIGKMLARGIGVGFDDEMGNLQRLIDNDLSELNNDIESGMSYGSFGGVGSVAGSTTISGVEINIYADQVGDSAESIADAVAVALQDLVDRRSAVYG